MFILGFLLGAFTTAIIFIISFIIIGILIKKAGRPINRFLSKEIEKLEQDFMDNTDIIYPNDTEAIFNKENSKVDDFLKL